jgi:hypothetical protein
MNLRYEVLAEVGPPQTRASGQFSGAEVASLLHRLGMYDTRQIGCPSHIFDFCLAENSKSIGVFPAMTLDPNDELSRRITELKLF